MFMLKRIGMAIQFAIVMTAVLAVSRPSVSLADRPSGAVEPAIDVLASLEGRGRGQGQAEFDRLAILRIRAEQGSSGAQHQLAAYLATGRGMRQDSVEAAAWFERAAQQGHSIAQFWIGNLYMRGVGVEQNTDHMMNWWRRAAVQGNIDAQYALGAAFRDGRMIPRDLCRSRAWFFMASGRTGPAFVPKPQKSTVRRIETPKAAEPTRAEIAKARRFARDYQSSAQGGR
jgi:hypothetical protein